MKKDHNPIRVFSFMCHLYMKRVNSMDKHHHIEEEELREYVERIRFNPVDTDPDVVFEKIRYRIRYGITGFRGVSPVWRYAAVAATVALLIVSALFVYSPKEKVQSLAYIDVKAIPGSKTRVVLPDSSEVWLNSNATLRYPQQFAANSRVVEFSGEALFNVKHNPKAPFSVIAEGLRIQVLGTEFNVFADPESHIIETTLLSGSVALFGNENNTKKADIILSPNQQALYDKRNGYINVLNVRAFSYTSWVSGLFVFEKSTLEEIATSLSRAFDVKISIESESLKKEQLTAQFVHQETLDEILSVLQISAHYNYKKEKDRIYITEK